MIEHILDIINNPNFKDFQKYIDILAETGEFSKALVDIEIEIIKSLDDSKISNYEMQLIGIKAFNIIKMLYNKKFKFKKLDGKNTIKIKDLIKKDLEKLLLVIISKIFNKIKEKFPQLQIQTNQIDIIIKTIVNTAEIAFDFSKKTKFNKYLCC